MNSFIEPIINLSPYSLDCLAKQDVYKKQLSLMTKHHYNSCSYYKKILDAYGYDPNIEQLPSRQPMLPVRLFKTLDLLSVNREDIVKTMTSSGTSGQAVSKIYLDKGNTHNQSRVLASIISSFIGKKRLPLLILDTEQVKRDRAMFSARGAGIVGFSTFGFDITYALNGQMEIDVERINNFLNKHSNETILMFGYTYMIWEHIVMALKRKEVNFNIDEGILFHIGGWKKIKEQAVSEDLYNESVKNTFGNVRVHNYYGMAEQLGSVFVECENGHMHCSNYSDVIIRKVDDFSEASAGETGLIEILSLLPSSYPGHILLTEDEGVILGEDNCSCGRLGKYFKIIGRIRGAELRGCSDTYVKR